MLGHNRCESNTQKGAYAIDKAFAYCPDLWMASNHVTVDTTREKYGPSGTGSVRNASNCLILLLLRQDAIRSS
jgi:hypothetical protein